MKTLTVRLPDPLVAEIESESRALKVTKSEVVRQRLQRGRSERGAARRSALASIADLVGVVDGLPEDLSARRKHHLRATGYGEKHRR